MTENNNITEETVPVKHKKWKCILLLPVMVIAIILMIAAFAGISVMIEKILITEDYLFYEFHPMAGMILILLIVLPVILGMMPIALKISQKTTEQMEEMNDILYIWNHMGKWRAVAVALWLVGLYCCVTSTTVVTEDAIICYSPVCPTGISYPYSSIEHITAEFGDKKLSFVEYKKEGNFSYQITIEGKKHVFHTPTINEKIERYEDTYLELEEFDQKLVELGIPKTTRKEGSEKCFLDQRYVDRFLRIIENQ